jgi:hypothetical protein
METYLYNDLLLSKFKKNVAMDAQQGSLIHVDVNGGHTILTICIFLVFMLDWK